MVKTSYSQGNDENKLQSIRWWWEQISQWDDGENKASQWDDGDNKLVNEMMVRPCYSQWDDGENKLQSRKWWEQVTVNQMMVRTN